MKKRVMVVLALFAAPLAFAQFHFLPGKDDAVRQWVQASYGRSTDLGFEAEQSFFSFGYNIDIAPFAAFLGMQFTDDVTDLTLDTDWWPFEFRMRHGVLRFGLGADYHIEWYNDISCEHDFIISPEIDWQSNTRYLLTLRTGLTKKISDIYAISETTVQNWSFALLLSLGKCWANGMEVRLEAGTRSVYRIPVFGSAIFTPSVAYTFRSGFRVGLEMEITMRDWIAATYYMDSAIFRVTGRMCF